MKIEIRGIRTCISFLMLWFKDKILAVAGHCYITDFVYQFNSIATDCGL